VTAEENTCVTGKPIVSSLLHEQKEMKHQHTLFKEERRKNVKGVLAVRKAKAVNPKRFPRSAI